ncbi:hypothetical protein [Candidatus Pollutiaquabacter sp.]|uniref:hypothetical protein n=1 Tax=Candidatus Pollutiaquabacter sp. TaxID=3416354 RepID=UPI003D0FE579
MRVIRSSIRSQRHWAAQPRSSACRFRSIASTDSRKPSTPGLKPFCDRKFAGAIGLGFLAAGQEAVLVERLATALQNGEWERRFGHRSAPFVDGALRLVVNVKG